jgi:ribonucleoside-diphosphate reductase alpha chain
MLKFERVLSNPTQDPYDITWKKEYIVIKNKNNEIKYECPNGEFPDSWSYDACKTVAQKYFREARDSRDKETSVKTMIERVVSTICKSGVYQQYFDEQESLTFGDELRKILLNQIASFNSPVWFNLGVPGVEKPQCSACFINSVDDNMESILDLVKVEGLIFKEGSGSGVNFSKLRASTERIRGGGNASGPVSFMQGYDGFARIILSGGRTRRAARMCILNADHPDILKFINCKADQEKIAELLVSTNMSAEFDDEENAYTYTKHQSGNHSVRVTDEFMEKVRDFLHYNKKSNWALKNVADDNLYKNIPIEEIFSAIAKAAHRCGDPGIQFHNTINRMNTCAEDGEITTSNPCSEFLWLNNSACNLASINLCKFIEKNRNFNVKLFKHVIRTMLIAQDILIDLSGYPTEKIAKNSHIYRPLGLGYTNLGGLLMSWGIPYDSDEGRNLAAAITSLMTGQAYLTSMEMANVKGPFERYEANKLCMEDVLNYHYTQTRQVSKDIAGISSKALSVWHDVISLGTGRKGIIEGKGFRNCQVTLLAPAGTISWMMDCATTGVEPDIGLKKSKYCVGGDILITTNPNIQSALVYLGYNESAITELLQYVEIHRHFENSILKKEHLPVFDCALPAGKRMISIDGHIKMVAAVQPLLSGAISKTFNMSHDSTVEDTKRVFLQAWENGLKCITVYRQGSKLSEPVRINEIKQSSLKTFTPQRLSLPDDIETLRHGFRIGAHKGYFHLGLDPVKNTPIELFIRMARFGSTVGGLLDCYATLFSKALQYGIPMEDLISHMEGSKFPPSGFTQNENIRSADSIMDYIAKFIRLNFLNKKEGLEEFEEFNRVSIIPDADDSFDISEEICPECGSFLRRVGTCAQCTNCAFSTGVCG